METLNLEMEKGIKISFPKMTLTQDLVKIYFFRSIRNVAS